MGLVRWVNVNGIKWIEIIWSIIISLLSHSGPRSFQYASVPLPLHQGYVKNASKAPPSKYANAELMKIPNFLHLTPPTISKQCEALKKFCTPFPKELKTETDQENHFPIRVITSDYVHGLPTIRNPLARIVTIKFKLSLLNFNERERDKFLRLVDERYDPQTDEVTITTDRCPIKRQNYDYAIYLLTGEFYHFVVLIFIYISTLITHTALYHESKNIEDWEGLKVEADMEKYIWENNKSKKSATEILNWNNTSSEIVPPKEYGESVEALMNEGENDYNLNSYKERVTQMLGVQAQWPMPKSMEIVQNVSIIHENELKQSEDVVEQNKSDRTFWYHP